MNAFSSRSAPYAGLKHKKYICRIIVDFNLFARIANSVRSLLKGTRAGMIPLNGTISRTKVCPLNYLTFGFEFDIHYSKTLM